MRGDKLIFSNPGGWQQQIGMATVSIYVISLEVPSEETQDERGAEQEVMPSFASESCGVLE